MQLQFLKSHVTYFGWKAKIYCHSIYIFRPGNESNREKTHNRETEWEREREREREREKEDLHQPAVYRIRYSTPMNH